MTNAANRKLSGEATRTSEADEVRAELDRLLASPVFSSTRRSQDFLSYAVEETLAGRGDQLKGYSIGVDIFDRAPDFDANTDPLVRVEARRLRQRLAEYYATEGRDNALRIEIPRGSYAARFTYATPPPVTGSRSGASLLLVGVACVGTLIAVATYFAPETAPLAVDLQAPGTPAPRIAVSPFANLTGQEEVSSFAAGVTEELIIHLREFEVPVFATPVSYGENPRSTDSLQLKEAGIDYVFSGSVRVEGEHLRTSVRLAETTTGAQALAVSFDDDFYASSPLSLQERIGMRIAALATNPFGPMYEHETLKIATLPVRDLDSYGCILQVRIYLKSLDKEAHARSRGCLLRVANDEPQRAQVWAALALLYQHEFWYGYNPSNSFSDALQRARDASRRALDIDGQNLLANLAMADVRYSSGDLEGFETASERSLSLSKNPSALAQLGFLMTLAGRSDRGLGFLEEAVAAEPDIPSWYYVAYSFNALVRDDYEQALFWALRADAPQWFAAPMAVAATAGLAGREDLAAHGLSQLLANEPEFVMVGRRRLERWIHDPGLRERIITGLAASGLELQ